MKPEILTQLPSVLKSKKLRVVSSAAVSLLIASACSGGEMKKQEEEFPRIVPLSGEVFLTQGAHANDDSPTGIKSSIDFAPKEVKNCPPGARVTVDQPAVATTSGTITIVGNERDRNDPNHSIVEIKEEGTNLRFGTMHLDDIEKNIQVGEKINKGDVLGKPSCEVPKGGQTTGVHIHSYVKDANGSFAPINGQEVSGWKIEGDKMTKKGEKARTADTRRCSTDTACEGIRNDLVNNPIKTSNKAVLGAAAGPVRPGPINATVNEKPVGAETPKPIPTPRPTEKPTPASPEKETVNPIVLLPIKVEEKNLSPGWKFVSVKGFVVENKSNKIMLIPLNNSAFSKSVLKSQEGFAYKNPDNKADWNCFGSSGGFNDRETLAQAQQKISPDLLRILKTEDNAVNPYYILNSLPPHFRVRGSFNYNTRGNISADDIQLCKKGLKFIAGEKTSGYRLNVPNFPEISLQNDTSSVDQLKFPTDRPDSDFKNPSTTINIPGKGSVAFEGAVSRTSIAPFTAELPGTKVKVRFRFHNDSIGYDQKFMLTIKLFGDDGILYTAMDDRAMNMFPTQPLYWDGYPIYTYVPPSNDQIQEVDIVVSSTLKSGKLMVSGDINEIFNLTLPEITNPVKR